MPPPTATPSASSAPTRTARRKRLLVTGPFALSVGFLTWIITFAAALRILPNPAMHPKPVWTAASGTPPDDRFSILMFPVTGSVPLFDNPDGVQSGQLLQRALANTVAEVESAGWVSVPEPAGLTYTRFADLSFFPPPGQEKPLLDALAKSLQARAGDPWITVALERKTIPNGERFTAKIHTDDYHCDSTYAVINGQATPEQFVIVSGKRVGFTALPLLFISALVAAIAAVVVICLVLRTRNRKAATGTSKSNHKPT